MNTERAKDITAIVNKLKEKAAASPWVPVGVPPWEHFQKFPDGLGICFTLDVLPDVRYWHLSIARGPSGPTLEEIEFWPRAFFDQVPAIVLEGKLPGFPTKHFYWGLNDGAS